jgi:hypothetical protein
MSHFTEIKTRIKDIEALRLACKEVAPSALRLTCGMAASKMTLVKQVGGPDRCLPKWPLSDCEAGGWLFCGS